MDRTAEVKTITIRESLWRFGAGEDAGLVQVEWFTIKLADWVGGVREQYPRLAGQRDHAAAVPRLSRHTLSV
jgi:hypothetical protein